MHDDFDRPPSDYRKTAHYPAAVTIGGIIWIVLGSLLMLGHGLNLLRVIAVIVIPPVQPDAGPMLLATGCVSFLVLLFALIFLIAGIQSVAGKAREMLGTGIGSIGFALLELGVAFLVLLAGNFVTGNWAADEYAIVVIGAVINGVVGIVFFLAGLLALLGRSDYKTWRNAKKALKRRRDEDEHVTVHDDLDRPADDFRKPPSFPALIMIAGIIWIILGFLIMLGQGLSLLLVLGAALSPHVRPDDTPALLGQACVGIFIFLFAVAFIYVGLQSVSGTARNTLSNAIGSVVFGLIEVALALFILNFGVALREVQDTVPVGIVKIGAVIHAGVGMLFILAGFLALAGQGDYVAWRNAKKAMKRRKSKENC